MKVLLNTNPETLHKSLYSTLPQKLCFGKMQNYTQWKTALETKLKELIAVPKVAGLAPAVVVQWAKEHNTFTEIRFLFESEPGYNVPCHLLLPKGVQKPPVIICLQGHSSGMHISLNRPASGIDQEHIQGGRDFGMQAVSRGYAALVLEQRGFGECMGDAKQAQEAGRCHLNAMQALLMGRTMLGERVLDVTRSIDAMQSTFADKVDTGRIACMGNSGGGTATYYAACLEKRISVAMPSCSVCSFQGSIFAMYHCQCNFIPQMLQWFEMEDIAALIAPRKLLVVAGQNDDIFPIEYTRKSYDIIEQIYRQEGVAQNCRLVVGAGGHQFYPEDAWPVFDEMCGWKK